MANETVIPQLRFPEFSGNWKTKEFGNLYGFKTTNSFSRDNLNYDSGNVKNIHYGDIHTKFNSQFDITKEIVPYINEDIDISRISDESYLIEGDLVIADASEDYADIGKSIEIINLNGENTLAGLHTILARRKSDDIAIGFASFILKTNAIRLEVMKIAQGSKVLSISAGRLAKIQLKLPEPEEQSKIASFIAKIDNQIQLLEKEKTLLEQYKKGISQKIFNQEIRFKDDNGNDFPDWQEKVLGDLGFFQTSSVDKLYREGEKEVFLVNYMNVYKHQNINKSTIKDLSIVTAKDTQIISNNLKKGDILFTPSSETADDIGHSVVIFEDLENTLYSYHLLRFRPKVKIDILYSHYFCNTANVLKQLTKLATGSTRFTISVNNFSNVRINLPPDLKEQHKIAIFLSNIDLIIDKKKVEIENSFLFKNSLLQKMFV